VKKMGAKVSKTDSEEKMLQKVQNDARTLTLPKIEASIEDKMNLLLNVSSFGGNNIYRAREPSEVDGYECVTIPKGTILYYNFPYTPFKGLEGLKHVAGDFPNTTHVYTSLEGAESLGSGYICGCRVNTSFHLMTLNNRKNIKKVLEVLKTKNQAPDKESTLPNKQNSQAANDVSKAAEPSLVELKSPERSETVDMDVKIDDAIRQLSAATEERTKKLKQVSSIDAIRFVTGYDINMWERFHELRKIHAVGWSNVLLHMTPNILFSRSRARIGPEVEETMRKGICECFSGSKIVGYIAGYMDGFLTDGFPEEIVLCSKSNDVEKYFDVPIIIEHPAAFRGKYAFFSNSFLSSQKRYLKSHYAGYVAMATLVAGIAFYQRSKVNDIQKQVLDNFAQLRNGCQEFRSIDEVIEKTMFLTAFTAPAWWFLTEGEPRDIASICSKIQLMSMEQKNNEFTRGFFSVIGIIPSFSFFRFVSAFLTSPFSKRLATKISKRMESLKASASVRDEDPENRKLQKVFGPDLAFVRSVTDLKELRKLIMLKRKHVIAFVFFKLDGKQRDIADVLETFASTLR
jgi:hypothetical protein